MTSAVGTQFAASRPQSHKEDPHRDNNTGWGAGPNPTADHNNRGKRLIPESPSLLSRSSLWEQLTDVDQIPLGKLQVMEKFFTPVELHQEIRGGAHDKGEHAGTGHHRHHHPHRSHSHHTRHLHPHHHHQDPQWAEDHKGQGSLHAGQDARQDCHSHHSQDHHHEPPHHPHYEHHQHHKSHHSTDVTPHTCTPTHTSATASSSILSSGSCSSSSSSSSSWSSEASINNEAFLVHSRCKLRHAQHSKSCTDISKGRSTFGEEDDEEDSRPLLSDDCHLYKSTSLERSLASRDKPEIPESRKPKKAVSSIQLPTKSILKKKQGQGGRVGKAGNVRKAKSMEVLSSQSERTGFGTSGGGGPINEKNLEQRKEEARQNFVKEKLQFSAFLNEITRQVLSPSRLSCLGVTNVQRPANAGLTSPKSTRDEHRGQGYMQEEGKQRQQSNRPGSPDSMASSAPSHCSKYSHSSQQHHCTSGGSPQLQSPTTGSHTDASTSPENSPSLKQGQGLRGGKQRHGGSNTLLTDGTNTSPELSPSFPRHHSHQSHSQGRHQYNYSTQHSPPHQPHHPKPAHPSPSHRDAFLGTQVAPEQESHPSRLDSPWHLASPEPKQTCHVVTEVQYENVMSEVNRIQILQKQNEELHHSLLQATMHMECMQVELKTNHRQLEVDLQRTQLELENLKDKFKRLQDNYSSTQQTNQLLEQKLQSVSQRMGGEHEGLSKRIVELTEQLATAQTIQSLEIINVPSLFQGAPEEGFEEEEAANQFLLPVALPPTQFMDNEHNKKILETGDNQLLGPVLEEEGSDWSVAGGGIKPGVPKGPGRGQRSVTAVLPWKQEQGRCVGPKRDRKGEVDAGIDSGRDEEVRECPPHSLQIPHLQFTMHPETLPIPTADLSLARFRSTPSHPSGQGYGVSSIHQLCSPIRVLSTSLEEMRSTRVKQLQPSPCTEAVLSLHHPEGGALEDSDGDDMLCDWRERNNKGKCGGAGSAGDHFEPGASLCSYQAAPRMVSHLMCQLQPIEVDTQGWTGEVAEEVLNGERTQL